MSAIMMGLVIAAVVGIVLVLCMSNALGRWIVGILVFAVLLGSSVYCCQQLNVYYSAEGGITGYLGSLLELNHVDKLDGLSFNLENPVFSAGVNQGEYEAVFKYEGETFSITNRQDYGVVVNGVPLDKPVSTSNYVGGNFNFIFFAEDNSVVLMDTLYVHVNFNPSDTQIVLRTRGGTEAVKRWKSYFNKNGFVLGITSEVL